MSATLPFFPKRFNKFQAFRASSLLLIVSGLPTDWCEFVPSQRWTNLIAQVTLQSKCEIIRRKKTRKMQKTHGRNKLFQSHSHVIPIVPYSHVLLLLWPTCKRSDQIRSAMLSVQPVTQTFYAGDSTPKSQTEIAHRNSLEASGKALTLAKTCRFVSASVHVQPDEDYLKLSQS